MNIPEEFGKYLLLKKLVEDPLGETFRAGKVGPEGMEQVVLLRVLNGKGIDGEKLWSRISGRTGLQALLKSPNIGNGVDLGRVRSFPYTAYDYISGKNLASVFQQAARQHSPIPTDHALLIAERISLALAAAYESRFLDERVPQGCASWRPAAGRTRPCGPTSPPRRWRARRLPAPTTSTPWAPSSTRC